VKVLRAVPEYDAVAGCSETKRLLYSRSGMILPTQGQ
jgi:hypothetical protein